METSRKALAGIFIVVIGVVLLLFNLRLIPYELYFLKSWKIIHKSRSIPSIWNGFCTQNI